MDIGIFFENMDIMSSLFRQQAVEAQKQKLHGDVSLAQPMSIYAITSILLCIIFAIVLFLSFSNYARKETVRGYLVPDGGLIKTYANRNGNIDVLHVSRKKLPYDCISCCWRNYCVGGSGVGATLSRYSRDNEFNNKSIYCDSLRQFYSYITMIMLDGGLLRGELENILNADLGISYSKKPFKNGNNIEFKEIVDVL